MIMVLTIVLEIVAAAVLLQAMGKLDSDVLNSLNVDSVQVLINDTFNDCCMVPTAYAVHRTSAEPLCWTIAHADTMSFDTSCQSDLVFRTDFVAWLKEKITPMATTALTLMSMEVFMITAACCAICKEP